MLIQKLIEAIQMGHFSEVQNLLKGYHDLVNKRDSFGYVPLHYAVYYHDLAIINILFQYGADINAVALNPHGASPLTFAAELNKTDVVECLLRMGAAPNLEDSHGCNALHIACYHGFIDIVNLLIEFGVNIRRSDSLGRNPFTYAIDGCQLKVYDLLLKREQQLNELLLEASKENDPKSIMAIIQLGANVNHSNQKRLTALHYSSYKGYHDNVRVLLYYRAAVNVPDKERNFPLHYASFKNHLQCASLLLQHDPILNKTNKKGYDPMQISAIKGNWKMVDLLFSYKKKQSLSSKKDNDSKDKNVKSFP